VLSLALTIGATTGAFRLIDAVLLRDLPVANPERLFYVTALLSDEGHKLTQLHDYMSTLVVPIAILFVAASLATLSPIIRAVRIDPATTLRTD
jgi:hypothetical protein